MNSVEDIYRDNETVLSLKSISIVESKKEEAEFIISSDLTKLVEDPGFLLTKIKDEVYIKLFPYARKFNNNNSISDSNTFRLITIAMQIVESYTSILPEKSGKQKKEIVLSVVGVMLSRIILDRESLKSAQKLLTEVIPGVIDALVLSSNARLNINKKDPSCCCCIM